MLRIFGDFESYYDTIYSLRKMSPVEYILDPRWETLACSVAINHEDPILLPQDDIANFLRDIKQPYAFISHNALFDACVLAYRYGIHPPALMCTLNLARATIYHQIPNGRLSLANVLKHLGLGVKGEFIHQMRGKHWADLMADPGLMMLFSAYAHNDCIGCRDIFYYLRPYFPVQEAMVMDRVIRMATQPLLQVDIGGLETYRALLLAKKNALLSRVALHDPGSLASAPKFAAMLLALGVDPPMKVSPSDPEGKKLTHAFAKTDQAFTDLLEHDNPMVQALVAARLGVKSTIEETRSTRFIAIGSYTQVYLGAPYMPVPLKYSGAHTHRMSGDWLLNMQNLSARKSKDIRRCLYAPNGYTIVAVDAAQIEARIVAWLAQQGDLLEMFANGVDTYKAFAADIFGLELTRVSKVHRFVGKTCIAEGTIVVTNKGNIPIEQLTFEHKLWDGVEWVQHQGVLFNGRKQTLQLCGNWLTPDHHVYVANDQKLEAGAVAQNVNLLSQSLAFAKAHLPSWDTCSETIEDYERSSSSATVSKSSSIQLTLMRLRVALLSAKSALDTAQQLGGKNILDTQTLCRMITPASDCLIALALCSPAAITQQTETINIMERGGYDCTRRGETTAESSYATSLLYRVTTMLRLNSTALIMIKDMNRATLDLCHAISTSVTNDALNTLNNASENLKNVYDIVNAGPRKRFAVVTNDGSYQTQILHNCILGLGYGMSARKLIFSIRTLSREQGIDLGFELTSKMCEDWVMTYRRKFSYIQQLWTDLNGLIERMARGQADEYEVGPCVVEGTTVILPSGLRLFYDNLRYEVNPQGKGNYVYDQAQFTKRLYGAKLLENIDQALDRQHVVEAGLRAETRARTMGIPDPRVLLNIHDENVHCVPDECAEAMARIALEEMARNVGWSEGLPLAAEVKLGKNLADMEEWKP